MKNEYKRIEKKARKFTFDNIDLALSFANRCMTHHKVMLMDCPIVWVVSLGDSESLIDMGYEVA